MLGTSRGASAPFIVTEIDSDTHAMLARNSFSTDYGERVAFADLRGRQISWTGDRTEFLGRNGSLDNPAALAGAAPLSNRVGAASRSVRRLANPCRAQAQRRDRNRFLSRRSGDQARDALSLVAKYRTADLDAVLAAVTRLWDDVLGTVQVKTPDRAMDIMLNRWLLYQTLACRVWARSAFYQASGAYGFRDQLQDVMALAVSKPDIDARASAARRRAPVRRRRRSALVASAVGPRRAHAGLRRPRMVAVHRRCIMSRPPTISAVLDETVPFLDGPALARWRRLNRTFCRRVAEDTGSLYEHCARALDLSLAVGSHGLPLIGSGDWNDGMNRVGEAGRGESIWLGWFLYAALSAFAPLAESRGEQRPRHGLAPSCGRLAGIAGAGRMGRRVGIGAATSMTERRLGSASSLECRIDSIAQSWGVISGAANPVRAALAMAAVDAIPRSPRRRPGPALHPAVRSHAARPRIHQRLSAGHPGERRPIHARGGLVGDRVRDAR